MIYLILLAVFVVVFLIYLKVAERFSIIDKPNERSSHSQVTIRGGGIIYLVAALAVVVLHPEFWMPVLALYIIGTISFADDMLTLSNKVRIFFHLAAVSTLFYYLDFFHLLPWWGTVLLYVFVIGVINAYNFMDGINGITGTYTLVTLLVLQYVNYFNTPFIEPDLIWLPILASLTFLYFNFRKRAKCFAGDVGSITVALWIVFLLATLIMQTAHFAYILFLAVYGVDSVLTILHRLTLRQNIFEAHRMHLYQILANENKISHLTITMLYGLTQLLISGMVVFSSLSLMTLVFVSLVPLIGLYVTLKFRIFVPIG